MLHYRRITAPRLVHPDVRKTGLFTHVRGNLRGDVSGKRFSTHVGEGNVADVAQERLSDGTGRIDTGYCHESLPRINAAAQHHNGI